MLHARSVVFLVELVVCVAKCVRSDRLTLFDHTVCDCLEFAEHRLSKQRRAEHIEIVRKQVFSKLTRSGFEQVLQEQHFVDSRCDFRNENFVIRFRFRKRGVAVIGVHGMSEFVRNGKHVVNGFW